MSNALLNAAVEVGGGAETSSADASAVRRWVESALREGAEEPIQGSTERGLQNIVYGKKNPLFSTSDETAVVNPKTALQEFGVGTAVGAAIDGLKQATGKAKDRLAVPNQGAYNGNQALRGDAA